MLNNLRVMFKVLISISLSLMMVLNIQGQTHNWTRTNPGGGGAYSTIEAGPPAANGAAQIIAGSDLSGAYFSWDGGQSWNVYGSERGVTTTHISGIGFHPTDAAIFYLGGDGGIFKTTTGGGYFVQVLSDGYISDIKVAASYNAIVYAAYHPAYNSTDAKVYKSSDGGDSWYSVSNSSLPSGIHILKLSIDKLNHNIVYAVSGNGRFASGPERLYRSFDGGVNWADISPDFDGVMDVAIDPVDANVVYCTSMENIYAPNGNCAEGNKGHLYRSFDQGTTWGLVTDLTGVIFIKADNNNVIRLIDPRCSFEWYSDSGTWSTTDYGTTWTRTGDPGTWGKGYQNNASTVWSYGESYNGLCKTIGGSLTEPDALFWTNPQWAFGSYDGGTSFNALHTKEVSTDTWQSTGFDNVVMLDIDINESDNNEMYIAYADIGLFRSQDGGNSWQMTNDAAFTGNWYGNGGNTRSVLCDPDRPGKVWVSQQGDSYESAYLLTSNNAGAPNSWVTSNNGIAQGDFLLGLSLDRTSNTNNRTLFVTMNGNVYRSQNDGQNWSLVLTNGGLYFTEVDHFNGQLVYAGGADGLFRSTNGGNTWSKVLDIPSNQNVQASPYGEQYAGISDIEADPSNTGEVYVSMYAANGGGIYFSSNNGLNFSQLYNSPYMRCVSIHSLNNQILYAGSSYAFYQGFYNSDSEGVLMSLDKGGSWTAVNESMPWTVAVTMDMTNTYPPTIFVGSPGSGFQKSVIPTSNVTVTLDLQICLEGPRISSTQMDNTLLQRDLLPPGQPFNTAPWNYLGTEGAGWGSSDYPAGAVDWVLLSLRETTAPSSTIARVAGIVLQDGTISSELMVPASSVQSAYYVLVEHRNHLPAMSPQAVSLVNNTLSYNFAASDSYSVGAGFGQKQIGVTWCLFSSNADQSDPTGYQISGADRILWQPLNGTFDEYRIVDFNLDGDINGQDKLQWSINSGIFSAIAK